MLRLKLYSILMSLMLFLSVYDVMAQKRKKPSTPASQAKEFLNTQWWLGIRGGTNFTQTSLIESFSGLNPINYNPENLDKEYEEFVNPAFHIGLDVTFFHKGFSVMTFPTFFRNNINYSSQLSWSGETERDQYETSYDVQQSITFLELPVAVKYDIIGNRIRPFVMAGAFYSIAFDANKEVQVFETDYASGQPVEFERANIKLNNKDEILNNWGLLGGLGVSFDFWNIRSIIDVQYRHSFQSIVNSQTRFDENTFSSFGEVQDDYSLQNYSASLSFVFPLRYIDSQFKAL
ncbi:outer membrane beta-barrel protein [Marivirga tractuosa]|nr:outer membrane beta-barrel protein [Marivirga tractuosa]